MLHEQPGQKGHAERFDQPVDEQRHRQAFGLARNAAQRGEIHLEHHRINHQPDEHGDGNVHLRALAELKLAQRGGECRREFAEQDAGDHAQENPDGQVTLEERQAFGVVGDIHKSKLTALPTADFRRVDF